MPPRRAVAGHGRGRGRGPAPPPEHPTLAQVMAQQTQLLQAIATGQQARVASHGSRLEEFMHTKPPVFSSESEPLEVDDWLCTMEKKLTLARCREEDKVVYATHQLTRLATDWWDNYLAARVVEESETAAVEEGA